MGLFTKKKPQPAPTPAANPAPTVLNLSKEQKVNVLNIKKQEVHALRLKKPVLNGLTSRVALVIDRSGSMRGVYENGMVQNAIEAIFPIALEFDDNGAMEMWIFDDGFHRLPDITIDNFDTYVRDVISRYSMGCTSYAPVMKDVIKRYTKEEPAKLPNYVVFITDGDNDDKRETDKVIIDAATKPVFWQFVGLKNGYSTSFDYLQALDDMEGRYVDNADFFIVNSLSDITYEKLLDEYPGWLADPKVQAMLQ